MPDVSKHEAVLQGLMDATYCTLGLSIGSQNVTSGLKIAKKDTESTPTLSAPAGLNDGFPFVHWIQVGFKVDRRNQELKTDELPFAPWVAAKTTPGAAPHRYVFFLYNQTPGSTVPPVLKGGILGNLQRMRFDLDAMIMQLGLGEIVAANYFVSN
ncbi:phosphatidylethanolamine-binding protein [Aspergillus pseudoustus]|uniref:Phosphatidylethanolamine-binding protein n=1 Tax=Aspergillus pseudoustus TaxID=1810923 RepID=A0ABR4J3Q0_9EURO